jgi:hypothetical protein
LIIVVGAWRLGVASQSAVGSRQFRFRKRRGGSIVEFRILPILITFLWHRVEHTSNLRQVLCVARVLAMLKHDLDYENRDGSQRLQSIRNGYEIVAL